jgi:hypothetical protein
MAKEGGRTEALKWFLGFLSADIEHLPDWRVAGLKAAAEHHFWVRLPIPAAGRIDFHGWNPGVSAWLPETISGSNDWRAILIEVRTELRNFLDRYFIAGDPSSFSALHDDSIEVYASFGIYGGVGQFEILPRVGRTSLDVLKACARINLAFLLSGVAQSAVRQCAHCGAFFLNTAKRKKLFCTPRCASRASAKAHREKNPEAYLKSQRELMRRQYQKKVAAQQGKPVEKVKVNHRKRGGK